MFSMSNVTVLIRNLNVSNTQYKLVTKMAKCYDIYQTNVTKLHILAYNIPF